MKPEYKNPNIGSQMAVVLYINADIKRYHRLVLETELAWLNHLLRNSHGPVSF